VLSVFLHRNVPGPLRGGFPGSRYHDVRQGTTHPGTYPQAPVWYRPQPGMPVGYDASQVLQQPPASQSPRSQYLPLLSPNEPHSPLGLARLQNPGPMTAAPSQGLAGVPIALGGSYSHQSANEPHSRYPLGFIRPQDPGPMTAVPPQGPVGVQNPLGGPYSQVHLYFTILRLSLIEDNRTGRTMVIKKRKVLSVCNHPTEYCMVVLMGI